MISNTDKFFRLLALSPSTFGFGFVVLEGNDILVDSGAKSTCKNKNDWCVEQAEKLIRKYEPHAMVLYDHAKNPQRSWRIKALNRRFAHLAKAQRVHVTLLFLDQVKQVLFPGGKGTKHEIATALAARMPDDLASKLPPKRRAWDNQDRRMDIFDALALAVAFRRLPK